jgi:hypothetical protein
MIQTREDCSLTGSSLASSLSTASFGRCSARSPHEQLVSYTIARVLERTTLEPLASHLEESVTGHGREPGSQ